MHISWASWGIPEWISQSYRRGRAWYPLLNWFCLSIWEEDPWFSTWDFSIHSIRIDRLSP
jgi:hypothetical protein